MSHFLNDLPLKKKFFILLFCCVLLPAISLDLVTATTYNLKQKENEAKERREDLEILANGFCQTINEIMSLSDLVYADESIYDLLFNQYSNEDEYYQQYLRFSNQFARKFVEKFNNLNKLRRLTVYTNNPTVARGYYIKMMDEISTKDWFRLLELSKDAQQVYCDTKERRISILTKLDNSMFHNMVDDISMKGIIKADLDMDLMDQMIHLCNYNSIIFLCYNGKVIFTNAGDECYLENIDSIVGKYDKNRITEGNVELVNWQCYAITEENSFWIKTLLTNRFHFPFLLLNLILPACLLIYIEKNMIQRIELLESRFTCGVDELNNNKQPEVNDDQKVVWDIQYELMHPIEGKYGKDEIGRLIEHYNKYIEYLKYISQEEKKQREEKAALELAKKQAELNALNSQVNPHFLYNSIESICMRSVLKKEYETADIMRDLSLLLREVSAWDHEERTLLEEITFIHHYLHIQKYRFGDKIQWMVNIQEECKKLRIPKLSILTLVENACIHGIEESLENGMIEILAYKKDNRYIIQIKDNGVGMTEEEQIKIMERLQNVSLESFKTSKSTGILSSYLRLHLLYGDDCTFSICSEEENGTTVEIQIKINEVKL